jgi:hypothetical protein
MDAEVVAHSRVVEETEEEIQMEKLTVDEVELQHDLKYT